MTREERRFPTMCDRSGQWRECEYTARRQASSADRRTRTVEPGVEHLIDRDIRKRVRRVSPLTFTKDDFVLTVEIEFRSVNIEEMHRLEVGRRQTSEILDGKLIGFLRILSEECSTIVSRDRCCRELHGYERTQQ